MRKSQISASMMCSNLVDLQATIDVFEKEKVEYLHIDVMDGEFVPNFGLWRRLHPRTAGTDEYSARSSSDD